MDYSKEQVITDILDQYERHLNFIHLHREAPGNSVMFPDGYQGSPVGERLTGAMVVTGS